MLTFVYPKYSDKTDLSIDPDQTVSKVCVTLPVCQKIWHLIRYSKCFKISYTKVSDKMTYANSADPDLTERIRVYTVIPLIILRNNYMKSNRPKNVSNKMFVFFRHLPYQIDMFKSGKYVKELFRVIKCTEICRFYNT